MSGFTTDQISIGQQVLAAVKSLGLSPADTQAAELDTIEAGLAESGLKNDNYGDYPSSMGGQMSSSRGVFQQISAWGPLSVREDPGQSALMFLKGGQAGQTGLLQVPGWDTMNSWNAVQAVQQSEFADGSNYQDQYQAAQSFVQQYGAGAPSTVAPGSPAAAAASGTATATNAGLSLTNPVTSAESSVLTFALKALFTVAGLGLIVLGVWRVSQPVRSKAAGAASSLPIAA